MFLARIELADRPNWQSTVTIHAVRCSVESIQFLPCDAMRKCGLCLTASEVMTYGGIQICILLL